jgi:hypothetical protein
VENGIEQQMTTLLWPQANGEIERKNRTILKRLRIAQAEGRNLRLEVDRFLMMYRSTTHMTTGVSPSELLYRRNYRTKLPQLGESTSESEVKGHWQPNLLGILPEYLISYFGRFVAFSC